MYGDPAVFGKKIGGDILCNKKTFLYINAYNLSSKSQREDLDRWAEYDGNDPDSKIAGVRAVYDAVGVKELSEKLIDSLFSQGLAKLDEVSLPECRKSIIRKYVESLMDRNI